MQNDDEERVADEEIFFHPCSVPAAEEHAPESHPEKNDADSKEIENVNKLKNEGSPVRFNSATPTLETVPEVQVTSFDDVTSNSATSVANSDDPCTSKAFQQKPPIKVNTRIFYCLYERLRNF